MDVTKYKLAGLKEFLGKPTVNSTLVGITSSAESSMKEMVDEGVLAAGEVKDVRTLHARKGFFGRAKDFLLWKTFVRRWSYKPFYEQVGLVKKFVELREHTNVFEDMSDDDFENLLQAVHTITVWEERYHDNPYSIVVVDACIIPATPVECINLSVTLEDE